MSAVDELNAYQCCLRAEHVGIDFIQGLAAQIVIAVAGGPGKAGIRNAVVLKGLHDLAGILPGDRVDLLKARAELCLRALRHIIYFGFDV